VLGGHWAHFIAPADVAAPDHQVTRLDGSRADVELTTSEVTYQREPAMLALVRDITERKRTMEFLARKTVALQQAEELGHLKDHFLSTMSHEMKTPLSLITGYAELLEDKYPDEELLVGIQDGARRLAEHIDKMLDYTALISGTLPLYLVDADLREIVAHVQAMMEPALQEAGLALDVQLAPDLPPVRCDERRVVQLLLELVDNARKFTPAGGRVALTAGSAGQHVHVQVRDTGPCIPEQSRGQIWEAFTQLETGDASRRGGLGLGLTIVKHLVELHGGEVALDCDNGTIVTVQLPIAGPTARPRVKISLWPSEVRRPTS
jgi:signal transduction histidine kinase